jgi:hypothetical protein
MRFKYGAKLICIRPRVDEACQRGVGPLLVTGWTGRVTCSFCKKKSQLLFFRTKITLGGPHVRNSKIHIEKK